MTDCQLKSFLRSTLTITFNLIDVYSCSHISQPAQVVDNQEWI